MNFTVQVADSEPTPSIATAQFSITILTITTSSLPAAKINQPYSATLTASGGSGKLSWCVVESSGQCDTGTGSLPPGLTLSATGVLAGTPGKLGTFAFTAKVTDSQKNPRLRDREPRDHGPICHYDDGVASRYPESSL